MLELLLKIVKGLLGLFVKSSCCGGICTTEEFQAYGDRAHWGTPEVKPEPAKPEPEPKKGMNISEKSKKLILDMEGINQPSIWPGGESGVSLGYGYDLGYEPNLEADWAGLLLPDEISRLKTAIGFKGENAKEKAKEFKDIRITKGAADKVFFERTLPEYIRMTQETFPGIENLPPDAQGALVSLVYNRGSSTTGERRKEMKAIRDLVPIGDLKGISEQIRSMKRLWIGKGLDGLLTRREAEAELVENAK